MAGAGDRNSGIAGCLGRHALVVVAASVWCFCCTVSASSQNQKYTVGIFLSPGASKVEFLERLARNISDPTSDQYGQYLAQHQLKDAIGIGLLSLGKLVELIEENFGHGELTTHYDSLIVTTEDWLETYKFAQQIRGYGELGQSILDTGAGVELLVTPGAPDDLCKSLSNTSQSKCEAAGPCKWNASAGINTSNTNTSTNSSGNGTCSGDSYGIMCWVGQDRERPREWRCIDQYNMTHKQSDAAKAKPRKGDAARQHQHPEIMRRQRSDIWRERRRGRAVSNVEPVAAWSILESNSSNSSNSSNGTKVKYKFRALSRSRSLELLVANWTLNLASVEFAFRQLGVRQSYLIKATDCEKYSRYSACRVSFVAENQRPVDEMAVCLDFNGSISTPAGCICEQNSTVDALGRLCRWLGGSSPSKDPVSFVLPYDLASPAAVREDLGIPAGLTQLTAADLPSQAVGEFSSETFGKEDLVFFTRLFGLNPSLLNVSVDTPHFYEVNRRGSNAGEGSLDVQYITALAPGAPTTWIGIDDFNMDGFLLAYTVHLNNQSNPPLVHSISWGDGELWFPPAFIKRLDYEFMKLALRGLTILISSGDNGISSSSASCSYVPDLSISEWTTMVGATMRSESALPYCSIFPSLQCSERGQEVCSTRAGAIITSSGGFSLHRKRPAYQDDAVNTYVSWVNQTDVTVKYNDSVPCFFAGHCELGPTVANNRGFPDISAPGHAYPVIIKERVGQYDGTSASAPVMAAMVTLLNAEQSRRGQPPLGHLNPWLYQVHAKAPYAFTDVTVGSIDSNEKYLCKAGFPAAPGWDAATGLGVPQFNHLRDLLPSWKTQTSVRTSGQTSATEQRNYEPGIAVSEKLAQPIALLAFCSGSVLTAIAAALIFRTGCWRQKESARRISSGRLQQSLL